MYLLRRCEVGVGGDGFQQIGTRGLDELDSWFLGLGH